MATLAMAMAKTQPTEAANIGRLDQVAVHFGVSPRTIKRWAREAGFPLKRVPTGKRMYVIWSEVEAWLQDSRQ